MTGLRLRRAGSVRTGGGSFLQISEAVEALIKAAHAPGFEIGETVNNLLNQGSSIVVNAASS